MGTGMGTLSPLHPVLPQKQTWRYCSVRDASRIVIKVNEDEMHPREVWVEPNIYNLTKYTALTRTPASNPDAMCVLRAG